MRCDYYAATVPASLSHLEQTIKSNFDGILCQEVPVRPYKNGFRHSEADFRVYWGGQNPLPFFVSSGEKAQAGSDFLRKLYPNHRVSRADVAYDLREVGGFDRIIGQIEPIARKAGVEVCFMGDPDPKKSTGRTMYFGSPKSDVRICVYEKGIFQRSKGDENAPADWVRVELRVRPRKERKSFCASASLAELWGLSRWSSTVAADVLETQSPFVPDPSLRRSETDQAIAHMLRQYASSIRKFCDMYGKDKLFSEINEVLDAS